MKDNKSTYVAPHPSEIIDRVLKGHGGKGSLYISGIEGAKNEALLRQLKIQSVLTVGSDIQYVRFSKEIE
jgi:hypothetical protein